MTFKGLDRHGEERFTPELYAGAFPAVGEVGVVYADTTRQPNLLYRWDTGAAVYVRIGGELIFPVGAYYPGIPTAGARMTRLALPVACRLMPAAALSVGTALAAATVAAAVARLYRVPVGGGAAVEVAQATWAAGGSLAPTFTTTGGLAYLFAVGDVIDVLCPAPANATLSDPSITIVFHR